MPWCELPGYEGLYEVSTSGEVRSVDRAVVDSRGRSRSLRGRQLRPNSAHAGGYLTVSLSREGCVVRETVHKLVALAFLGPRPVGLEVRHLDNDPRNNALTNLEYATHSANESDKATFGTHNNARKTHCPSGHLYAGDNLRLTKTGRTCRTCERVSQRAYYQRRVAARLL